jgi:hypothetical protein
MHNVWRH